MGADRRLFKHVRLPAGFEPEYLDWIPFKPGESLGQYAFRLSEKIDKTKPFVLIGLSLGGLMAVEIARRFPPVCTILIASVPLSMQFPAHFRMAQRLRLHELIPPGLIKSVASFKRVFTHESKEDKKLIRQMIRDTDPGFLTWAMQAALDWKNEQVPAPLCHLHGTRDEVFPVWLTKPTHKIPRGGHVLVMSHPEAVNHHLHQILGPFARAVPLQQEAG